MEKINLERFICSLIEAFPDFKESGRIPCMYKQALQDQGLEYKNGEIVKTQRRVSAEAKVALFDWTNATIRQKDWAEAAPKPKFKVGDIICDKCCTTLGKENQPNFQIIAIENGLYVCDKCSFPISSQDEYELIYEPIEDAAERREGWSEEEIKIKNLIFNLIALLEHGLPRRGIKDYVDEIIYVARMSTIHEQIKASDARRR